MGSQHGEQSPTGNFSYLSRAGVIPAGLQGQNPESCYALAWDAPASLSTPSPLDVKVAVAVRVLGRPRQLETLPLCITMRPTTCIVKRSRAKDFVWKLTEDI